MRCHGCCDCIGKLGLCLAFDEIQQKLSTEYIVFTYKHVQDWLIGTQFAVVAHVSKHEING